jgi:hypothetical protein
MKRDASKTNNDTALRDAINRPSDLESVGRLAPRLLDLHGAAAYLGVSYWVCRDYVFAGLLPHVTLPCAQQRRKDGAVVRKAGDRSMRKILLDVRDLDSLIDRCKEVAN